MSSRATLAEKVVKAIRVGGLYTPADVLERISDGRMQHWEDGETIVVTAVYDHTTAKVCKTELVAGDLETAWKIHDEQILPWAKSIGCTRMTGEGRQGWAKTARDHGYTKQWICAAMEI